MEDMYNVKSGSFATELSNSIDDSQTTITVDDTSVLPDAPNYATIGEDNQKYEVIQYDEIDGDDLKDCTREVEGTAQSFDSGTEVARYIVAKDINDIQNNILGATENYEVLTYDDGNLTKVEEYETSDQENLVKETNLAYDSDNSLTEVEEIIGDTTVIQTFNYDDEGNLENVERSVS